MQVLLRKARYGGGATGVIEFAEYGNGQTAMLLSCAGTGEPLFKPTVNLEELGAPEPGQDQVWLKTWSENEGVADDLVAAGIVKLTGQQFHVGHDAYALLADLTPLAVEALRIARGSSRRPG